MKYRAIAVVNSAYTHVDLFMEGEGTDFENRLERFSGRAGHVKVAPDVVRSDYGSGYFTILLEIEYG